MSTALRALIVDDSEEDALKLLGTLEGAGYNLFYSRVSTEETMRAELVHREWDLVISDWQLKAFGAVGALALLREAGLDLPFVVVSGTAGEVIAVEAMRAGAQDFLVKNNLARLVPAIERELREAAVRAETRSARKELRASEETFRLLVEGVRDFAIFMMDPAGAVVTWNSSAERIMGYGAEEVRGQNFALFHRVEDTRAGLLEEMLTAVLRDGRAERQLWCLRRDGSRFWANEVISALRDEDGGVRGFSTVVRDITDRKQADEIRRVSEAKFRRVFESNMIGIYFWHLNGDITIANEAFLRMVGKEREDPREKRLSWRAITPPEYRLIDERALLELRETSVASPFEKQFLHANGKRVPVLIGAASLDGTGDGGVAFVIDLTERKRVEQALRETEERLRTVITNAPVMLFATEKDGTLSLLEGKALGLIGLKAGEVVGQSAFEIFSKMPWITSNLRHALDGESVSSVAQMGTLWFETQYAPLRGPTGEIVGAIGVGTDVTERKRAEDERTELVVREEAALEASRLKSEFVANISHELRTPMNSLIGLAGILLDTKLGERQREYVTTMKRSSESLLTMINDILDLSKIEAGKLDVETLDFDLATVVADAFKLLAPMAQAKGIRLESVIAPGVPERLRGDAARVGQILINIGGNAVKFTDQGQVSLSVVLAAPLAGGGATVRFEVRDTGIGIAPGIRDQLFQAFSQGDGSMSRRYGGTGLGLSISRRLVGLMGGQIGFESEPGKGSTFWFAVPFGLARTATPELRPVPAPARKARAGGRILVVEDNPVNREVALQMLRKLGYRAEFAEEAETALATLARRGYDLVLMDCQLPGMDGYEATRRIREREQAGASRVPIVAMTANAMKGDRERCLAAGMDDYLSKPIDTAKLGELLAKWMPVRAEQPKLARLDRGSLEKLRALRGPGKPDFLGHMVSVFIEVTPTRLHRMRAAFAENDLAAVAREAHIVKSSSASLGAARMADLSRRLEKAGKGGAPALPLATRLMSRLEREYRSVKLALARELKTFRKAG